jgi:hypothetical protein
VAAPAQGLEALVRDELRGPVAELVRRLVPELVAETLNGSGPSAAVVLPGADTPPQPTNGAAATPDTSSVSTAPTTRRCKICGVDKPLSAFGPHRHQCKPCRNPQAVARERRRREAVAADDDGDQGLAGAA